MDEWTKSFLVSIIINATECSIQRPCKVLQQIFYSGKIKQHALKYEIGVSIQTGLIVWIGSRVVGSIHDLTIAKNSLLQVYSNKIFIENKRYVGYERILTPFKTPTNQSKELWNSLIRKLRVSVEHVYGRIKIFHCLNVS